MYAKFWKRFFDFFISLFALILLIPLLLILTIVGFFMMKGNPFFVQQRPGRNEKIFSLVKFRTMTNEKDQNGDILPDEKRLIPYGKFLRSTSLDELPELFNILKGDMAIVGPRPLAVIYLPYYTKEERRRHSVRPGLTGMAQVNGRNSISWEEKFLYDLKYIDELSLRTDVKIIFQTAKKVLCRADIGQGEASPISLHIERAHKDINQESGGC